MSSLESNSRRRLEARKVFLDVCLWAFSRA
jgi:hypothetical protein